MFVENKTFVENFIVCRKFSRLSKIICGKFPNLYKAYLFVEKFLDQVKFSIAKIP